LNAHREYKKYYKYQSDRGYKLSGSRAGFTIVEVLITLVIVGVMLVVAIPPMVDFLEDMQMSSDTNDLLSSLLMARSEAVTRNSTVSLCKIDPNSPTACDNSESWQSGWIAFEDLDADGVRDGGEEILETYLGMGESTSVTSTGFANYLSYRPSGATNTNGNLTICVNSTIAQDIVINATGRPRIAESSCP